MNILVFNCGSSSLNYKVFTAQSGGALSAEYSGKAHRVGVKGDEPAFIEHRGPDGSARHTTPIPDHRTAAGLVLDYLEAQSVPIEAIGHRFVHGGSLFQSTTLLTPQALDRLQATLPLAPIHNPNSLSVIEVTLRRLAGVPEYVTFDTAFHASLPPWAYTYALPLEIIRQYGFRKYGFHGLSYRYVTRAASNFLGRPLESLRVIACHLGTGGSSAAAVASGRSVDTSMGFTPLPGLVMSTRTGDLDPLLPLYLMREMGYDPAQLETLFNKQSGLLGVSGFSSDLRDIIYRMDGEETGDSRDRAGLAFELYTRRLRKYIGAYAALLGGFDLLIFTDDIGVQNWRVRESACAGLDWCGLRLDADANRAAQPDRINRISAPDFRGAGAGDANRRRAGDRSGGLRCCCLNPSSPRSTGVTSMEARPTKAPSNSPPSGWPPCRTRSSPPLLSLTCCPTAC